jgi:hypothetical protein
MAHLLHSNEKFVGVHNKCSKIQPSHLKHFASRVRRNCVVRLSRSSRYAGSAIQNASEQFVWCIQLYFVNFLLRQTPQTKNLMNRFTQLYLGHQSESDTYSYEFSSHINVSLWITLYSVEKQDNEQWSGKDVEDSGRNLIWGTATEIWLEGLTKSARNLGYSADLDLNLGPSDTKQRLSVLRTALLKQWRTQEFFSGEVQQIQLRREGRENGDLGAVAP